MINFYQLNIKKKMLPLRYARFCCAYIKEQHGAGAFTYPGVERAVKRSIQVLIDTVGYGSKYDLNADQIFDWYVSNKSLAEYAGTLRQREIEFRE